MKVLSFGAGQQSTALALMSCDNVLHPGKFPVPVYDAIIFCDLGGEREWVYKQVDFVRQVCYMVRIPFFILKDKNLKVDYFERYGQQRVSAIPFWSIDENGRKGKMRRHCTIDYKIIQIQNFVRWNLLGYKKGQRLKLEDIGAHEMHIGFTAEERQRIFESKNKLFINKYPMVDMGLTRKDNYAYVVENWGLKTRGSACLFCPFHTNYFFWQCKNTCEEDYKVVLDFDELLENGIPNRRLGVPDSKVFICRSRKRIRNLEQEECMDQRTFPYNGESIWDGF